MLHSFFTSLVRAPCWGQSLFEVIQPTDPRMQVTSYIYIIYRSSYYFSKAHHSLTLFPRISRMKCSETRRTFCASVWSGVRVCAPERSESRHFALWNASEKSSRLMPVQKWVVDIDVYWCFLVPKCPDMSRHFQVQRRPGVRMYGQRTCYLQCSIVFRISPMFDTLICWAMNEQDRK